MKITLFALLCKPFCISYILALNVHRVKAKGKQRTTALSSPTKKEA